ncbi:hypothetical protein QYE76_047285 [Lolium multiflorum]|uniref:Ubiquitin-like domain-containing protein n=1 Tax=Lolium multiflorum TaxID=4521 RepID=A0AAD8TRF2_LOLMU|nr:hypothetical protein QYE76_047285 [Lolium multiflorum]
MHKMDASITRTAPHLYQATSSMDVTIDTTQGGELTLRGVRFFATVLWIKEVIRNRLGIPVQSQRLFFMGQELDDDRNMMHYSIHHGSRLLLIDAAAPAPSGGSIALDLQAAAVHVVTPVPAPGGSSSSITLDLPAPKSLMDLLFDEAEREDGGALVDYNPPAEGRMEVVADATRQPAAANWQHGMGVAVPVRKPTDAVNAGNRMVVTLESYGQNTAALLEVNAHDTAGEMRREVARMAAHLRPPEEYFFIHGQDIMRDERTLRWHDVRDGDTITLFPGTISSAVSSSALSHDSS